MQTYQDQPSRLTSVAHRFREQALVPEERLQRLVHMAERKYQTLAAAIPVPGRLLRNRRRGLAVRR